MLIGLAIRDVVLARALDLDFGPGLTVLTGETGAGKSIILGALGLALGARSDAGLVRRGAAQASAAAAFALPPSHPVWPLLEEKALVMSPGEDLVLRRVLGADGRSRAFVNDQPAGVAVLRELGELLVETHGQHETVGLLDARTHRGHLDAYARLDLDACAAAWAAWRAALARLTELEEAQARGAAERESLSATLSELDRLAPREGEEAALVEERALLGAAERALADIAAARSGLDADALSARLGTAFRALTRARERALAAGVGEDGAAPTRLAAAIAAIDRVLIEAGEATAAIDAAAELFDFEPQALEKAEGRLFALRAAARRLNLSVDELPAARADAALRLADLDDAGGALERADAAARSGEEAWRASAAALNAARQAAGEQLAAAVQAELAPLKLGKARFQVAVEPLPASRFGPAGADAVEFRIATVTAAPLAPLASIASGGELARIALALKAVLSGGGEPGAPLMIFDEVDQGVGGAVADAVGQRLARLAADGQVLVVTHSPQVAARAEAHWRVSRDGDTATVATLGAPAREEEIARMLSGAIITDAARAAARALMAA